jgi:hypothetical protein
VRKSRRNLPGKPSVYLDRVLIQPERAMSLFRHQSGESGGRPRRFFVELIIIFVGVYGAFWVERYQQELEDREKALSILEALDTEITQVVIYGPSVLEVMDGALDAFDRATEEGLNPPPAFYREPEAETPNTSVWEATVASGGVALLDPDLFYDIAWYYHRLTSFSQRYLRYTAFTEREILPLLSRGGGAFYDPQSGELEPRFMVHMDQFRILRDDALAVLVRADSLAPRVKEEIVRLR